MVAKAAAARPALAVVASQVGDAHRRSRLPGQSLALALAGRNQLCLATLARLAWRLPACRAPWVSACTARMEEVLARQPSAWYQQAYGRLAARYTSAGVLLCYIALLHVKSVGEHWPHFLVLEWEPGGDSAASPSRIICRATALQQICPALVGVASPRPAVALSEVWGGEAVELSDKLYRLGLSARSLYFSEGARHLCRGTCNQAPARSEISR